MMLKEAIDEIAGLRYMTDDLELRSGLSRRMLYGRPFMRDRKLIEAELDDTERMSAALADDSLSRTMQSIDVKLAGIRDIGGTVRRIGAGRTLGDLDLFEIKVFALLSVGLSALSAVAAPGVVGIPDLSGVVGILDPEGSEVPYFAIYDAYSPELAGVRRKIKLGGTEDGGTELYAENARLEDGIRQKLSGEIYACRADIETAMEEVARLDILIAKAKQAKALGLCRPSVSDDTQYAGLFNPPVRNALKERDKDYQPVDIGIGRGPTLVTGTNMGGKTLLLRSIALAQALFQYGFHVPASQARIAIVDEILTSIGDSRDEMGGLSSFAAEMVKLNGIIGRIRSGSDALTLIDEPARTTNPIEGGALVNALIGFLARSGVRSIVTTHYGGIKADCRRLRVRGFTGDAGAGEVTVSNIHEYMDYSLTEGGGDAPCEALRVAGILGVDKRLLDDAEEYMRKNY